MPKAEQPKWEEELEKLIERKWRHGTPIEYSLDEEELIEVKSFIQKTIDSEVEAREKEIEEAVEKISLVIAQSAPFSLVPLWKDADFDHLKKGILELLTSHHNQLLDRVMEELGPEQDMRLSILGGASPGKVQGYNMCLSQSKEVIKSLKV